MGLSFLNKKIWHPGTFANIEKVWIAEQKQREAERRALENTKKLKEERQIEELKKIQVEAGLIPESQLGRMDWMYQAPDSNDKIQTAEDFLLGKPVEDVKKKVIPVFQESHSNIQNEIFTKIHEDPLFAMKKEELRARKEIEENPYRMKMLLKEIEENISKHKKNKKDKKDKKEKKHKKDKKEKKQKKDKKEKKKSHIRSYSSSEVSYSSKSESYSKHIKKEIITPSLLKSNLVDNNYGLHDKNGKRILYENKKSLGPEESLYEERHNLQLKHEELKRKGHSTLNYKSLSEKEKELLRQEMEESARNYDKEKINKLEDKTKSNIQKSLNNLQQYSHLNDCDKRNISLLNKPGFLKSIKMEENDD
jgi:hypothetical protein